MIYILRERGGMKSCLFFAHTVLLEQIFFLAFRHTAIPSALKSRRWPYSLIHPICLAGLPTTKAYAGISLVTTAPAPINANSPISCPQTMVEFARSRRLFFTMVRVYCPRLLTALRGLVTLVKNHRWAQKKHIFFANHPGINGNIVLHLDVVAQFHLW